jgi:hypothetical protein
MFAFGFTHPLALLMLKGLPGRLDPEIGLEIVMTVGLSILIYGAWAIGYFIGNTQRRALLGTAVSLGLVALIPIQTPFGSMRGSVLLAAMWIWLWCALGYRIGDKRGHAVAGGVWGALLGPLGTLLILCLYQPPDHSVKPDS